MVQKSHREQKELSAAEMVRSLEGNKLGTGLSVLRHANNLKIEKSDRNGYSMNNF